MSRSPLKFRGTLAYCSSWLNPWRPVFRTRTPNSGLLFHVHRRDGIGRHIAKYGAHEPELTRWIRQHLAANPPGVVVDVGANIGWHALHCAQSDRVEAVFAFEPDHFNADLLRRNVAANKADKITIDKRALGARAEQRPLYRYKDANLGRHSMVFDEGFGSTTVDVIDLDTALAEIDPSSRPISLLKIDVEGFEGDVIAGAARTLARSHALLIEHTNTSAVHQPLAALSAAGFTAFELAESGALRPYDGSHRAIVDLIWLRTTSTSSINQHLKRTTAHAL